jgi:hypothetical protein
MLFELPGHKSICVHPWSNKPASSESLTESVKLLRSTKEELLARFPCMAQLEKIGMDSLFAAYQSLYFETWEEGILVRT